MKATVFTSSPNKDGLTVTCGKAAMQGMKDAGADVQHIDLNKLNIGRCRVCGHGWGTCFKDHVCQVKDDFQETHEKIKDSDAYIIVTPVYWSEMSESAKAFLTGLGGVRHSRKCLRKKASCTRNQLSGLLQQEEAVMEQLLALNHWSGSSNK